MKKLFIVLPVALLAACATAPPTPAQIVAQINTQVCPIAKAAIVIAPTLQGVDAAARDRIDKAGNAVDTVCAAGAMLDGANLRTLVNTALPAILGIARAVPNPDPNVVAVIDGLTLAQALLPILIAQVEALK